MICAYTDMIHPGTREDICQTVLRLTPPGSLRVANLAAAGVNPLQLTRLGITHAHQPHIWQLRNAAVIDLNGHEVMLAAGDVQRLTEVVVVDEVAEYEARTAALDDLCQVLHGLLHIRAMARRFEVQEFANDVKDMLASFLGRYELLDAVGEEDDADLVVVLNGAEGQRGSDLGLHIALCLHDGTEIKAAADIHQEHDREFALLLEDLDIRLVEASGHIPLDVPDVVAILIFSHLAEGHTATLEGRMVFARKDVVRKAASLDFYLSDTLKYFRCFQLSNCQIVELSN